MKLEEAKQQFIQAWGSLATQWGINRTMAQVHALLLVSPEAMSAEEVMEALDISRGNVNMNMRELIDWGLVERVYKQGERKEFFSAEKDIWKVTRQVARERKRRELEPVLKVLESLQKVEGDKKDPAYKSFTEAMQGIHRVAKNAEKGIDLLSKSEESMFFNLLLKILK
ncbi:MAG: helix-turn-helix domain-containing protein [Cytophagaceae bacterium]|jgi:DNA-binding transcriptional regulator GbsR (MarR family)|nr:helix-turn-helix domain-containing protein [Cytophagaceae bacterium]